MTRRVICDACGDEITAEEGHVQEGGLDFHDTPECLEAYRQARHEALERVKETAKGQRDDRIRDQVKARAGLA